MTQVRVSDTCAVTSGLLTTSICNVFNSTIKFDALNVAGVIGHKDIPGNIGSWMKHGVISCMYWCMYVCMYVHVCVFIYLFMYVCVYLYIYMHIAYVYKLVCKDVIHTLMNV